MKLLDRLTRRGALTTAAAATVTASVANATESLPTTAGIAFMHGVASGDPTSSAVVIWSRISSTSASATPVNWMVATDKAMKKIVRSGTTMAFASRDYTLKADVTGLKPGTTYYYAFKAGPATSPVGKTKTAPVGAVKALNIALVSCSNYPAGYFNAYRAIADRSDIDLVMHVGDYIYEYGAGGYATQFGATVGRVPDPPTEIVSLSDYRRRYAQYRTDPDLQAAHAAAPWIVTWDDHEVTNDTWVQGAENHNPKTQGPFAERERVAMQAYYEWMPIRDPITGKPFESINRTFQFGDLVTIVMLETRLQARSQQLDYEKDLTFLPLDVTTSPPSPITDPARLALLDPTKPPVGVVMAPDIRTFMTTKLADPNRQLMGPTQEAWVAEKLTQSVAAGTRWQLMGNQVIMAKVTAPDLTKTLNDDVKAKISSIYPPLKQFIELSRFGVPYNLDAWDGYPAARERFYAIAKAAKANLVVVTGDTHANWANELNDASGQRVGVEFGGTSVTSPGIGDLFAPAGLSGKDFGKLFTDANKDVVWHDETARGFVFVTLTPDAVEASYQEVDTVTSKSFKVREGARFRAKRSAAGVSALETLA